MPIDPSIPLQAQAPAPPNPLAMIGQYQSLASNRLALQSAQQQYRARQAIGPIYQQAIDPATGQLDSNKLLVGASQNPDTAWIAGDIAQQALDRQKTQVGISGEQQTQALAGLGYYSTQLTNLVQNPNTKQSDVLGAIHQSVLDGVMSPERAAQEAQAVPSDPGALRNYLVNHLVNTSQGLEALKATIGTPGTINTGPQIIGTRSSIFGGVQPTGVVANMGLSPEAAAPYSNLTASDRATPITLTKPDGSTFQTTKGAIADSMGGAAPGGAPSAMGNGRYPGLPPGLAGQSPTSPASPPATAPAPGIPALSTGPSIAQQEGMKGAADAGVDAYKNANASVAGSGNRIYTLQTALTALQGAKTGPGTDVVHNLNGVFAAQAPALAAAYGATPEQLSNYDLANKYLTSYASQAASKFGPTTDSQLATALSANASTHINKLAAVDVVKANLGLENMNQDVMKSFQAGIDPKTGQPMTTKPGPESYADYASKFALNTDARAYVLPYLDQAKAQAMIKSMTPADQTKFYDTYDRGIASGSIQPPAWAAPPTGAPPSAP